MELIIKPTSRCNFNCNFCSAGLLKIKTITKVPSELKQVLFTIKPDNLIITGGDPLMMSPSYYEELLTLGDWNISFTTNLKDFYLNPSKWTNLFKNNRIGICTSFQYGTGRLWDKNTPYTEAKFIEVMTLFKEKVGYVPSFISVITNENEEKALDHVYLAKKLNTKCKLNPLSAMGKSKDFYPRYKMVDIWLKIKELGLEEYLDSQIQFYEGGCGFNTNLLCESTIRVFWLDNNNAIQYSNCEDCANEGFRIPLDTDRVPPIENNIPIDEVINDKCLYCELFKFCNACKMNRNTNKLTLNHCEEMLKRKNKILEAQWKI